VKLFAPQLWIILAISLMVTSTHAQAQSDAEEQSSSETVDKQAEAGKEDAGDSEESLPKKKRTLTYNEYEGPLLYTRVGALIIGDYNIFSQDKASFAQVGDVPNEFEFRAARLVVRGTMGRNRRISYFYAGEYNGMSREPDDSALRMTDLAFTADLGKYGDLTLGKTKEPIHLARIMPGDGVLLMERASMDALVPSRGTGFKLHNTALNQNLTWTVGWFSDFFASGNSTRDLHKQFTGRITGTPVYEDKGRELIHLGLAYRHAQASSDMLRFREPPEAHTAPDFIDTGEFPADKSRTINLEFGMVEGPWSIQAEYLKMYVSSPERGDPRFNGWYLAGSWILTGESRSYQRKGGFFYKVSPNNPVGRGKGAFELVFRYSDTDFTDRQVYGGEFQRWSVGANWFATDQWRLEANYGQGKLNRFGLNGKTDFLQFRLQWQM
jgi:phosphate-selective porin OprO/OprP